MATFNQIKSRVTDIIIDDNAEVLEEMDTYIQNAQEELEDLRLFRETKYQSLFTTSEGVRSLGAIPSNWNGIRRDPYYLDGQGVTHPMMWLPDTEEVVKEYDDYDPLETGPPEVIFLSWNSDGQIWVYPYPDALCPSGDVTSDGNYRIYVPYWKRLSTLSGDTDNVFTTNPLTLKFILEKAASDCFQYNRDFHELAIWSEKAARTLRKIKNKNKSSMIPRNATLRPRRSVNASRTQRRL